MSSIYLVMSPVNYGYNFWPIQLIEVKQVIHLAWLHCYTKNHHLALKETLTVQYLKFFLEFPTFYMQSRLKKILSP